MKQIIIKTQAEFDALPLKFEESTQIIIQNDPTQGPVYVSVARDNASVVARDNSSVEAWNNSSVVAWGNVGVHLRSYNASVILYMFAVCWILTDDPIQIRPSKSFRYWCLLGSSY